MVYRLQSFLLALAEPDKDGRVILSREESTSGSRAQPSITLKYLLLNPEETFRSLVDQTRSVVLAGGTNQMLLYFSHSSIHAF